MTDEERAQVDASAEKIRAWLNTPEGRDAVIRASKASKASARRRAKARRVSSEELHKPVTI